MSTRDEELLSKWTRMMGDTLEVCRVVWQGPHTPEARWERVVTFSPEVAPAQRKTTRRKVLSDARWFLVCRECGENNPIGHMHDQGTCQSCAERVGKVVY